MTLVRSMIRDLAVKVIIGLDTTAGQFIFPSRDTSLQQGDVPAVCVWVMSERGVGEPGRTIPTFTTTLTLILDCVAASTNLLKCEAMLDELSEQVAEGLLRSLDFAGAKNPDNGGKLFEGYTDMVVTVAFSGEGDRHIGNARIALGIRYHDVYPPLVKQAFLSVKTDTDAIRPMDAAGQYTPDNPAPRTQGPDGRIEIGSIISLPQPKP